MRTISASDPIAAESYWRLLYRAVMGDPVASAVVTAIILTLAFWTMLIIWDHGKSIEANGAAIAKLTATVERIEATQIKHGETLARIDANVAILTALATGNSPATDEPVAD